MKPTFGSFCARAPEIDIDLDIDATINILPDSLYVPDDFTDKMREMAQVYSYLYLVENSLRLFVLCVIRANFGSDELTNLRLLARQENKIRERKMLEERKKWMRTRGESDIFYLDFIDILSIIRENWDIFRNYFESIHWIAVKLEELRDCRNVIAHNGYVGETEINLIKSNFEVILKQIKNAIQ